MWVWLWTILVACVIIYFLFLKPATGDQNTGGNFDLFVDTTKTFVEQKKETDTSNEYTKISTSAGKQILILFGTEYGLSEEVARQLFQRLKSLNQENSELWQPRLLNMKYYQVIDLSKEQIILFVCSTAGDGVPPSDAKEFFTYLNESKLDLSHLLSSVLALGDSNYLHYCRAGKILNQRLNELGAKSLNPIKNIDCEDWSSINKWITNIYETLPTLNLQIRNDYLSVDALKELDTEKGYHRNRPYSAQILIKRPLTKIITPDDKETIHIEFDLGDSNIQWLPGDALGIYPINNQRSVDLLLELLGTSKKDILIEVPPQATTRFSPQQEASKAKVSIPLSEALLCLYDLKYINPLIIQFLIELAKSEQEINYGKSLLSKGLSLSENKGLASYIHAREVFDVVSAFPSAASALKEDRSNELCRKFISYLRLLLPRYYSVSSSPIVNPTRVSVTAAVVRYSLFGRDGEGVCTTFLQDRMKVGDKCYVFMSTNHEFRLPKDPQIPIIMIGPGTGIAPFRAFLQERARIENCGQNVLYFGCRYEKRDFLYDEELKNLESKGQLLLRTAFSRDSKEKIYVQNLILQDQNMIVKLIKEGCHIYVCGDGAKMAEDVHQALIKCLEEDTSVSGSRILQELSNSGRYQRDVWLT